MATRAFSKETTPVVSDELAFVELFRTPIICVPSAEVVDFAPYVGSSFPVLAVDEALLKETKSKYNDQTFLSSPPCIVALLTSDPQKIALLTELKEALEQLNAPFVPIPRLVDFGDLNSVISALADGIATIIPSQAKLISLLSREAAQLRQKNEQIQNQFYSLEAFLDRRGEQPCEVVFACAPSTELSGEVSYQMTQGEHLGQLLPVASQGLCGFALNIISAGERDCQLKVVLRTPEDGKVLGEWKTQGKLLRIGWNTFALLRSVAGLRRSIRLELSVSGLGRSPEIALAELQPVSRFQILDIEKGHSVSDRNLAIRLFAGLPGLLVPDWFSTANKDILGCREIRMPTTLLAPVRQIQFNEGVDYPEVVFLADEGAILCHPPATGTTVAEIPSIIPPGTFRLSMVAYLPSSLSNPVEFMLRVTIAGQELSSSRVIRSEWICVEAEGSVLINLFFQEPTLSSTSLELLSRMCIAGNANFAWAKFKDLVVVSQKNSAS